MLRVEFTRFFNTKTWILPVFSPVFLLRKAPVFYQKWARLKNLQHCNWRLPIKYFVSSVPSSLSTCNIDGSCCVLELLRGNRRWSIQEMAQKNLDWQVSYTRQQETYTIGRLYLGWSRPSRRLGNKFFLLLFCLAPRAHSLWFWWGSKLLNFLVKIHIQLFLLQTSRNVLKHIIHEWGGHIWPFHDDLRPQKKSIVTHWQ